MDPPAAGWYRDPWGLGVLRWWDGSCWTGYTLTPPASASAEDEAIAPGPRTRSGADGAIGVANEATPGEIGPAEGADGSGWVVKRWAKYGHDRWYVHDSEGVRVGFWDNKTGTAVVDDPARRAAFDAAITAYRVKGTTLAAPSVTPVTPAGPRLATAVDSARDVTPPPPAISPPAPMIAGPPPGDPRPWRDLAANRAGESAREQAVASRQAAPVRTVLARMLGVHTDERAWRLGADGEEAVALQLLRLDPGWKLLYAVPVGERGSDIDHVVIGPGGVFTLNAKHHPDASVWVGGNTFMVNGHTYHYVRNSRFERVRAARLLTAAVGFSVPTTAMIVVVGAHRGLTIKSQPPGDDVVIVARKQVAAWLGARRRILNNQQIATIYDHARRSTTWT